MRDDDERTTAPLPDPPADRPDSPRSASPDVAAEGGTADETEVRAEAGVGAEADAPDGPSRDGRWKRYLTRFVHRVERGVDRVGNAADRLGGYDPLVVVPYLSYGTHERVWVQVRVIEDEGLAPTAEEDSAWRNLRNALKRFASDEVPGARVRIEVGGADVEMTTDDEGFATGWIDLPAPLPVHDPDGPDLVPLRATLLSPLPEGQRGTAFEGRVALARPGARFGVISDVDDTVLQTGATSLRSMAKKVLFGNARTRLPFEGVAGFYAALTRGGNPIFYVSSSPWNLYDVLMEFLQLNDIPLGPLMLRDWGVGPTELLPTSHGSHKVEAIERVLATYPDLPFLLIGDSGQEDPEIYARLVHDHPERVLGIVIRDVTGTAERQADIRELAAEVAEAGSVLELVPDTVEAARHAVGRGWIRAEDVATVLRAKAEDEAAPAE